MEKINNDYKWWKFRFNFLRCVNIGLVILRFLLLYSVGVFMRDVYVVVKLKCFL